MGQSGAVTSDTATLTASLASYARRLHAAAGDQHQVASPLGAWLLLALCAPAATGAGRAELTQVLGCDPEVASRLALGLLSQPHPLVAAAAAVWTRPGMPLSEAFRAWQAGLPVAVQTGDLPGQAGLDAWARDHTFGLIEQFPLKVNDAVYLALATALATRVSWQTPFDLAPAAELGPGSPWARQLGQVLKTPSGKPGHRQFIAVTPEAGDVAVHLARARGGLLVASVAADASVAKADVLAVAQRLGCACAVGADVPRRPLAELPLGEAPLWLLREEPAADGGGADAVTAVLPAWSARSMIALDDPALGFGAAAAALAGPDPWTAAQSAMARYSRTGFEAAAVTSMFASTSMRRPRPGVRRAAELRFAHPYAVVAVAADDSEGREPAADPPGPWQGVPVFSAWVTDPEEAADAADGADAADRERGTVP
jgi:hypothetical protein